MKRKKTFDNPCIFMCCTLLSHFASLPCVSVCLYQSPTITQQCFPLSHLIHSVSASILPPQPTPLPLALILSVSDCSPAIPSVSSEIILLQHTPRNGKVTSLTRNMELCAAAVPVYSHTHWCVISRTYSSGLKTVTQPILSIWYLLPRKA